MNSNYRYGGEWVSADMNSLRSLRDRRQPRLHDRSGKSRRGGGGRCGWLAGLTAMPELIHRPMKPLQSESRAVEEQNGVVLVILAASVERHLRFPQLIVVKLHRNPIFLRLAQWSGLRLVNRSRFEFIYIEIKIKTNTSSNQSHIRTFSRIFSLNQTVTYIAKCSTCWKIRPWRKDLTSDCTIDRTVERSWALPWSCSTFFCLERERGREREFQEPGRKLRWQGRDPPGADMARSDWWVTVVPQRI